MNKLYIGIISFAKNINNGLCFFLLGVILPLLIFFYRTICCFINGPFLFKHFTVFSITSSVWEIIIFCYLPAIVLYLFLCKKKSLFFVGIFTKCNKLFLIYAIMIKIERSFYHNTLGKMFGFFLLFVYFYIYLLVAFKGNVLEVPFLAFRQLMISYYAFRRFLDTEYNTVENSVYISYFHSLSFYSSFYKNYVELQTEEKLLTSGIFYNVNSFIFICLYKRNDTIKWRIEEYNIYLEKLLSALQNQPVHDTEYLQDLYKEKNEVFAFQSKRPFFFFLALEMFSNVLKKCKVFEEKLKNVTFTEEFSKII